MSSTTQLDQAQVIKRVYDDTYGTLAMIPAYVGTTALFTATSAGASFTSSPVNILPFKVTGIVVSWTGLNTADPSVQFQGSVDGTFYDNIGSATVLSATPGHQSYSLVDEPFQYFKIVYNHGTATTGTISASYIQRA